MKCKKKDNDEVGQSSSEKSDTKCLTTNDTALTEGEDVDSQCDEVVGFDGNHNVVVMQEFAKDEVILIRNTKTMTFKLF